MKTQSIELFPLIYRKDRTLGVTLRGVRSAMGLTTRALLGTLPALAVVIGATWLVAIPSLVHFLQAATWAAGFVFLALAVESERSETSLLLAVTGIALPVLAFLSSRVAVELAIVAAMLVAVWIAAALIRRQP